MYVVHCVLRVPRRVAYFTAAEWVVAFSAPYELLEWRLTMVLSPDEAGYCYNGEQGDVWDAHKDMALTVPGMAIGVGVLLCARPKVRRT